MIDNGNDSIASGISMTTDNANCCPLCCCHEFTSGDTQYPLHCPTKACHFQYCHYCIEALIQSNQDGYTEASDGSYQVKISIRCPMCRASYSTKSTGTNDGGMTSPSAASHMIVTAILKLRRAASIYIPSSSSSTSASSATTNKNTIIPVKDSDLSASELTRRNQFVRSVTILELKDAIRTVQQYYDAIDTKDCGTVPSLCWDDWDAYYQQQQQQQQQSSNSRSSSSSNNLNDNETTTTTTTTGAVATTTTTTQATTLLLTRDPTLFMGLDELLTYDEQEFITQLLISGNVELLAQAAQLLHSIILLLQQQQQQHNTTKMTTPKTTATTTNTSKTMTKPPPKNSKPKKTMAQIDHEQKIRKKFPIPTHMPRVVTIPPYNPLNCKQPPIKFIKVPPPSKMNNNKKPPTVSTNPSNNTNDSNATQTDATISVSNHSHSIPNNINNNNKSNSTELTLASVHGIAGRVGLRRGDIVTHVNQERVTTVSEYTIAVQYALDQEVQQQNQQSNNEESSSSLLSMTITVNANDEIAQQLLQRAQQMKQQNVRFHN